MNKKFLIANWKMNLNPRQSQSIALSCLKRLPTATSVTTVVCPSFTSLQSVVAIARRTRHVAVGAQDCFWKSTGSYTGEESPAVLYEIGARFVLVGHSERRIHLHETDAIVQLKVKAIQDSKLVPIICIGESISEKKSGKTFSILSKQLKAALCNAKPFLPFLIAYEPVWAIGTGNAITASENRKVTLWIRDYLQKHVHSRSASNTPILYGGSVDTHNICSIMTDGGVNGVLVGSASLTSRALVGLHGALHSCS